MREIEIKARVHDKAELLRALSKKHIKLSDPTEQHDVVYCIEGTQDNAPGSVWLRLRTENNTRSIFTLKKQFRGGLDSIEHETEVADEAEMRRIIETLGFTLYSDLTKTRQKAHVGDVEICLDEVQGLGCFMEAEKLTDVDADGDAVEDELWAVLVGFGLRKQDQVREGYDVLKRAQTTQR